MTDNKENNPNVKNVMIHLLSTYSGINSEDDEQSFQRDDEEIYTDENTSPDSLDMTTEGVIRVRDGRIEIEYEETELTGMDGSITCISFKRENPEIISMIRTGSVSTALVFEKGKRHICAYNTDLAAFEICVKATEVSNSMTEDGGEITLDYGVEFRGTSTEHTYVKIAVATTSQQSTDGT